ncbi:MAG: hypothetical protein LCH61_20125 [Proteobacteria bacterium]|nr:hypothetical protein [Pseudomonadota bacterium]
MRRYLLPAAAFVALVAGPALAQVIQQPAPPAAKAPAARHAPNKDEAAKAAPVEKCARYDLARNAVYAAEVRTIIPEMPQPGQFKNGEEFQGSVEKVYAKYETEAKGGDIGAVRKLTAIEMFIMHMAKKDSPEPTMKKACTLATLPEAQRVILDPLACAVLSLEGTRRDDAANRERAKTMMATAMAMVPKDANATHAGKLLYDETAKGLEGCF